MNVYEKSNRGANCTICNTVIVIIIIIIIFYAKPFPFGNWILCLMKYNAIILIYFLIYKSGIFTGKP